MYSINHLSSYLTENAARFPEKTAIIFQDHALSYAECLSSARKFAQFLRKNSLQRGDRVVVASGNCIETIIAFWGTLLADGVISIIDATQSFEKIAYILSDAAASVFVGKNLPQYEFLETATNSLLSIDVANFPAILNSCVESYTQPKQLDIDLASIIYTSGSTGEPKGVMLTHRNMLAASQSINHYLHNTAQDKVISALPLSFDYGLYQMILMIAVGGTLILEADFLLPSQLLKKISRYQATAVPVVPSMVQLLKQFQTKKSFDVSSVRYTSNTGAALHLNHIQDLQTLFPQAKIFSMYGLTECKRCTYLPPQDIERKPDSIGIPIPNTEMWIVDEDGNRLAANQLGEIVVRGQTVMKGYLNKAEATAKKMKPGLLPGEHILHTGDYGMMDEEGYFYFYGRADEVIKSRGLKVSPKEIEMIINKHPDIQESAAVAIDHAQYGQAIVLFVDSATSNATHLLEQYCKTNLAQHQQPIEIIHFPHLPKTTNGKIDKKVLKAHYQQAAI